jgi:hypothetical protein
MRGRSCGKRSKKAHRSRYNGEGRHEVARTNRSARTASVRSAQCCSPWRLSCRCDGGDGRWVAAGVMRGLQLRIRRGRPLLQGLGASWNQGDRLRRCPEPGRKGFPVGPSARRGDGRSLGRSAQADDPSSSLLHGFTCSSPLHGHLASGPCQLLCRNPAHLPGELAAS